MMDKIFGSGHATDHKSLWYTLHKAHDNNLILRKRTEALRKKRRDEKANPPKKVTESPVGKPQPKHSTSKK